MSELKAIYSADAVIRKVQLVYIKSKADKVIAEKDKEIAELKDSIGKLLKAKTEQVLDEVLQKCLIYGEGFVPVEHAMRIIAELRHQKYKRCLAMARWCDEVMMSCELRGHAVHRIWANKHKWAMRWKYRWLELAEKFKEAK